MTPVGGLTPLKKPSGDWKTIRRPFQTIPFSPDMLVLSEV